MTSSFDVLTLGDALITFNPNSKGPLRFVSNFSRNVGGAELNFAIGCARLGLRAKWVSRLGEDEFGKVIYNFARGEGIDVSEVKFVAGYPTSLNFKEIREDGSGKTFYYRHHSPMLTMHPSNITEDLFEGVQVVHLTGAFLAIDPKNVDIALQLLKTAKKRNVTVSFDPNIRLKLWTLEEAKKAYERLFPYVDILLTGLDEIEMIVGNNNVVSLEKFASIYSIAQLVIKDGGNGAKVYVNNEWFEKEAFKITPVDTVGAGDGFDAGYMYSYLNNYSSMDCLTFANAVGALVTTVTGDNEGLPTLEEVQAFIGNKKIVER